jgi:hypothetical protein
MRFAMLRVNSVTNEPVKQSFTRRLIYIAYNIIWWLPIVLPLIKVIDYRTGFISFLIVTIFRAFANLYRNNILTPEQAENFSLRAP